VIQERDAIHWRDACLLYFQTFSKRPLPDGVEKSQKPLEEYKRTSLISTSSIDISTKDLKGSQVGKGCLPPSLLLAIQLSQSGGKPPFLTCDPYQWQLSGVASARTVRALTAPR
jgi:hypothetical protein